MLRVWVILILLFSQRLYAQAPPSSVAVSAAGSSGDTSSGGLQLNVAIRRNERLLFGASRTTTKTDEDGDRRKEVLSNGFNLGYRMSPHLPFSAGISVDGWGLERDFRKNSVNLLFTGNHSDWGFDLEPQYSKVTMALQDPDDKDLKFDSHGYRLEIANSSLEGWIFRIYGEQYFYSIDPEVLNTDLAETLFTLTAINLSASLLNYAVGTGVSYDFFQFSVSLGFEQSQSAVDESRQNEARFGFDWFINDHWAIGTEIASVRYLPKGENENSNDEDWDRSSSVSIMAAFSWDSRTKTSQSKPDASY